jgi:lipopolysaccharide export system permease protein
LGEKARSIQARYDNSTDILLRGEAAFRKDQRISQPNFLLPPNLDQYGGQLIAENAYYLPPTQDHPGGYLLDKMIRPKNLHEKPSLSWKGRPVVLTPRDYPWLKPDQCFVVSDIDFEQLTGGRVWREYSSTASLIRGLHNPSLDLGADVRVRVHGRIVQPLRDLNLLFLGLPLVVRREQRNVFVALGLGVLVVSLFTTVILTCEYLGSIYLISPALAAWLPLFIFVPVAVAQTDWLWE